MNMKLFPPILSSRETGNALLLTLIMGTIALAILASVMAWSSSSARLTQRSVEYTRSVAAAEAATEKAASSITRDFLNGGERLVSDNLNSYRNNSVPTARESVYWRNWRFDDANGNAGQIFVRRTPGTSYVVLNSTYAGLKGYVTTYTVAAHARDTANLQEVPGGVLQELQLAGIPIFQFAMYSSGNMEISCGQPFSITGRVHANKHLYVEPDSALTFQSAVTAVTDILFQRDPQDSRNSPAGTVVYVNPNLKSSPVTAMILPIGTTNTPEAIREIIEPPPAGESASSALGKLRYYNRCDLVVSVSDFGVQATSGSFNNFGTTIPPAELATFISTDSRFRDARENKTINSVDLDVGALNAWSRTNARLTSTTIGTNFSSIYIADRRSTVAGRLNAVRVVNGMQLPAAGLTVATARPLYVLGDFNQFNSGNLGTTNTSTTRPAWLVGDAITILSGNWRDNNSTNGVGSRNAIATTVNAALLTGVVETAGGRYSGGMENFPRFLETWGAGNTFTYNGSMVKMFPSVYATGVWGQPDVYVPPRRNWSYDLNFEDPTKLPPQTPSLFTVVRKRWATIAPGQNTVVTNY